MPTASPSIEARDGAVLEMVSTPVSADRPSRVMATPAIAVSSGMPAANSEPNVTVSTTRATATPMSSLVCPVLWLLPYADPPTSTVSPASFAGWVVFSSEVRLSSCSSARVT